MITVVIGTDVVNQMAHPFRREVFFLGPPKPILMAISARLAT